MLAYIIRKVLYAIPILIGVNVLTFAIFFFVNTPDQMAKKILGEKHVTQESIEQWKRNHGYHLPLFWNDGSKQPVKGLERLTETIFWQKSIRLFVFDFGESDRNNIDIGHQIKRRYGPSLAIALPTFILGTMIYITSAMLLAFFRGTYLDFWGLVIFVLAMSISSLFYIIGGQYLFALSFKLVPISGYDYGLHSLKFAALPVVVEIASLVGAEARFYRTIFLEEIGKDYVRTARAKGLAEGKVLFKHALKNAMIPILTTLVMELPFLFMGSLVIEAFFAVPGLGSFTIDAINAQDFAIVRVMVFLSSLLYIAGLLITDISYTLVDPRVRLQ